MLGEALLPLVLVCTLVATAGLAVVPQARSTITPVRAAEYAPAPAGTVRAEGHREGGEPITADAALRPGESLIVTATGFEHGAQVAIRLSGLRQGTGTDFADATGTVHFIYQLPSVLAPGPYRVIIEQVGAAVTAPTTRVSGNLAVTVSNFALLAFRVS